MPTRTTSEYDLTFTTSGGSVVGLMLHRPLARDARSMGPSEIRRGLTPSEQGSGFANPDVPRQWSTWVRGAGYSRAGDERGGYSYAVNGICRYPNLFIPGGYNTTETLPAAVSGQSGSPQFTASVEAGGDFYACCGRYLVKWASGTGSPVVAADLGAGFTADGMVVFDNAIYIGGYGGNLKKWSGGVLSTAPSSARGKLAVVNWTLGGNLASALGSGTSAGVNYDVLIGTTGDYNSAGIKFCPRGSDPMVEANWSGPFEVGDNSYPITRVIGTTHHAYFLKRDGVYDMDGRGYSPNFLPVMRANQHDSNGLAGIAYDGFLYLSYGYGITRIPLNADTRMDVPSECGVGYGLSNETPLHGWVTDFCNDNGWLVSALYSPLGTGTYICYGQDRRTIGINGPGGVLWHGAEAFISGVQVTHLHVSSPGNEPRLRWFGLNGTTPVCGWISLPAASNPMEDLLLGGPWRAAQEATLYQTVDDWGDAGAKKAILEWTINVDNIGDGNSATLFAESDGGLTPTWVEQGTASHDVRTSFIAGGSPQTGYALGTKISLIGNTDNPPMLRNLKALAQVIVRQRKGLTCTVKIAEGMELRNGAKDRRDPMSVLADVIALTQEGPVTMLDNHGITRNVIIRQAMEARDVEGNVKREGDIYLTLMVTELATSATYGASIYGGGDQYS